MNAECQYNMRYDPESKNRENEKPYVCECPAGTAKYFDYQTNKTSCISACDDRFEHQRTKTHKVICFLYNQKHITSIFVNINIIFVIR